MADPLHPPLSDGLASQKEMPASLPNGSAQDASQAPSLAETVLPAVAPEYSNPANTANGNENGRGSGSASRNGNGKVAIPRHRQGIAPRYNRRVPRACESCRQRKTKCSGDTPVCRQCRELRVTCQYPVGWKERTKKQVERLSEKAQEYENLLKDLGSFVEHRTADRIKTLLDKVRVAPSPKALLVTNGRSSMAWRSTILPTTPSPTPPPLRMKSKRTKRWTSRARPRLLVP